MPLQDSAWKRTAIRVENNCRVVAVFEPKKRQRLACSKCGVLAIPKSYAEREHHALHRVLMMGRYRVYTCVKQPLIHCRSCGRQAVCYPKWLQAGKRQTQPLRALISGLCRRMSCSAVAELFGLSHTAVRTIDAQVLKETTKSMDLSATRRLLVDEKRIGRRCFMTIVLDGDSHRVLHTAKGRDSEALASFLRSLAPTIKQQIQAVAMDGSRAYRRAVKNELPNAKICLDRFHLYRDIHRMMRIACQEISDSREGKVQRQLIQRIASLTSRDDRQAQTLLDELSASHQLNAQLIALLRLFKSAWQHTTFHRAATHLQGFAQVAMHSSIRVVKKFGKRIARDADYIAQAIALKLTNAGIESLNRKIADLLRRGYGYQDLEYLTLKIRQLSTPYLPLDCVTKTF